MAGLGQVVACMNDVAVVVVAVGLGMYRSCFIGTEPRESRVDRWREWGTGCRIEATDGGDERVWRYTR
jgi:hypothetical protein